MKAFTLSWCAVRLRIRWQIPDGGSLKKAGAHWSALPLIWSSNEEIKLGNPQLIVEPSEYTDLNFFSLCRERQTTTYTRYRRARSAVPRLAMFEGQPHAFVIRQAKSDDSLRAIAMIEEFIKAHSR